MSTYYAPLDQEALLHITGPDSLTFLQGQVTCDTRKIDTGRALPGAYCTPQGRMVCDFLLCQLGPQHYALRMRRDIRDSSAAVFGKYIVFSKAQLEPRRDDWTIVACWGDSAAQTLASIFEDIPRQRFSATDSDGCVLIQIDEQGQQFECYLDTARQAELLQRIGELSQPGTEEQWQARQILNGTARIEAATSGEFIPQMLNYDLTGHVSFNKGCYTGQEVVARMHYRGKPKRRMYLAELPGTDSARAGAPLYSPGNEQSVGNIVNAVGGGQALALFVATAAGVENGLHLGLPDGPCLALRDLPYSLQPDPGPA